MVVPIHFLLRPGQEKEATGCAVCCPMMQDTNEQAHGYCNTTVKKKIWHDGLEGVSVFQWAMQSAGNLAPLVVSSEDKAWQ